MIYYCEFCDIDNSDGSFDNSICVENILNLIWFEAKSENRF